MTSRFVSWLHAAIGTGFEFPRPRRGDTMPSKNRCLARRLGVEQLETRQMLTATLLQTLNNPTPLESDNFGNSVAISGNTIVVGAYGDYSGAAGMWGVGSTYIFDATSGTLLHTLNNPTPARQEYFGSSVAISGNTIAVGAWGDAGRAGRAYLFDTTTGALLHTLNSPTQDQGLFGYSVAVSANTLVVGAPFDEVNQTAVGRAYVFDTTTGSLLHALDNPTPANSDQFGFSVAISGNTLVVGALCDDTGATDAGSAYVFDATTGTLLHTLHNPIPEISDLFGASVAISGSTIAVGAVYDDAGATDAGSAYVFDATTGALLHTLNNPTPEFDDDFGASVAISGNTIVVGAWGDNTGATDAGSAYVFDATSGGLLDTLNNPNPAVDERFHFSQGLAIAGNTVVVGAIDHAGAEYAGSAYIFNLVDADFNDDGSYDCLDIDALVADIAAGTHSPLFDLTGDGLVNLGDRDAWLAQAGEINLGPGRRLPRG